MSLIGSPIPPVAQQLSEYIEYGNITVPRGFQTDGAQGSGIIHYTYFVAQQSLKCAFINFTTGTTVQAGYTYSNVGLYQVNSDGSLTLLTEGTSQALNGTYAAQSFTMTSAPLLSAGTLYAVGMLQVATTPASIFGDYFQNAYLNSPPLLSALGATGQNALPVNASEPTTPSSLAYYYELVE